MKHLLKYIFLLITICVIVTPVEAKKKQRKSQKTSSVKKKVNKKKTNNNKTVVAKKTANLNKVNLNELLNETTVTVAPSKSDSVPEKVVTILSAFKPQLKNVAKIGFVNATALVDSLLYI